MYIQTELLTFLWLHLNCNFVDYLTKIKKLRISVIKLLPVYETERHANEIYQKINFEKFNLPALLAYLVWRFTFVSAAS